MTTDHQFLTDEQLTELEKRLIAAEEELLTAYNQNTPAIKGLATVNLEFNSAYYIRRLFDDVKHYRNVALT